MYTENPNDYCETVWYNFLANVYGNSSDDAFELILLLDSNIPTGKPFLINKLLDKISFSYFIERNKDLNDRIIQSFIDYKITELTLQEQEQLTNVIITSFQGLNDKKRFFYHFYQFITHNNLMNQINKHILYNPIKFLASGLNNYWLYK